jgi:hypothetical protein
MLAVCFAALIGFSIAAEAPKADFLKSFEGNLSTQQLDLVSLTSVFGIDGINSAEVVKFKVPKPGWVLENIGILAWDGFNGSRETLPDPQVIAIEIRDKNLTLLYEYADSQIPYTNFQRNSTDPVIMNFEIPSIPVTDEFYALLYDRGALAVGTAFNVTADSFIFHKNDGRLIKAILPARENNNTIPVNWIMTAMGR